MRAPAGRGGGGGGAAGAGGAEGERGRQARRHRRRAARGGAGTARPGPVTDHIKRFSRHIFFGDIFNYHPYFFYIFTYTYKFINKLID